MIEIIIMNNPQPVQASIEFINQTNLEPTTIKREGAGKAYQSVALSMSIAIQDVTDYQRGIMAMVQAVVGVSMEKIVQNPETNLAQYSPVIAEAQGIVNKAVDTFAKVGSEAGKILEDFPSGD